MGKRLTWLLLSDPDVAATVSAVPLETRLVGVEGFYPVHRPRQNKNKNKNKQKTDQAISVWNPDPPSE